MKKFFTMLVAVLLVPAFACAGAVKPKARAWWVETDGVLVSAGNEHKKLAPASLTKMMTVLIALERCGLEDPIKISRTAEAETGHKLGLKTGQEFRVVDMCAAAVIASANDGARSLAEHVAGTEPAFARIMNEHAAKLGMKDTHFTNAAGHDDPNHYSSAYDLAILAREAMKNPTYAELAGMIDLKIRSKAGKMYYLDNKNQLIGRYEGAIGVKTGTTPNAGKSLAAMAKRDNRSALVIILAAKERWYQTERLLDLAFSHVPAPVAATVPASLSAPLSAPPQPPATVQLTVSNSVTAKASAETVGQATTPAVEPAALPAQGAPAR